MSDGAPGNGLSAAIDAGVDVSDRAGVCACAADGVDGEQPAAAAAETAAEEEMKVRRETRMGPRNVGGIVTRQLARFAVRGGQPIKWDPREKATNLWGSRRAGDFL